MKNHLILLSGLLFLLFSSSCKQEVSNVADLKAEKHAVENVLEKYVIANENKDFSMIEQIWAPDSSILLFGTDSDEKLMGWTNIQAAIKKQSSSINETYISVSDQHINVDSTGNTAWFAEILNYNFVYQGQARSYEGVRFTGVLEKRPEGWKIVQAHLSIPAHVGIKTAIKQDDR